LYRIQKQAKPIEEIVPLLELRLERLILVLAYRLFPLIFTDEAAQYSHKILGGTDLFLREVVFEYNTSTHAIAWRGANQDE
jgi:hypothetical protein